MTDQVLDVLKLVLLALLYVFFARVLWAVWSEVRRPVNVRAEGTAQPAASPPPAMPTVEGRRAVKPARGRGGTPARLVVLEPKERRGTAFAIGERIGIGRETDNTVVISDDAFISSHHAAVSTHDGGIVVEDLDSRNGTYLNGIRLAQRQPVSTGDRIQVGYTVLEAQ